MLMVDRGPKPDSNAANRRAEMVALPGSSIEAAAVVEIEITARGLVTQNPTVP